MIVRVLNLPLRFQPILMNVQRILLALSPSQILMGSCDVFFVKCKIVYKNHIINGFKLTCKPTLPFFYVHRPDPMQNLYYFVLQMMISFDNPVCQKYLQIYFSIEYYLKREFIYYNVLPCLYPYYHKYYLVYSKTSL